MAQARNNNTYLHRHCLVLEDEEIEQFAQYDGVCDVCHTPYYGILDESRLILPLGKGLTKFLFRNKIYDGCSLSYDNSSRSLSNAKGVIALSNYEIRMDIVRSGLFKRDQLRGGLYTQHEMEVCDQAFLKLRPRRCDCHFGEMTEEELDILRMCGIDPTPDPCETTGVDDSFIESGPVRTGYRCRSPASRRARRKRSKSANSIRHRTEVQQPVMVVYPRVDPRYRVEDFGLPLPFPDIPLRLTFGLGTQLRSLNRRRIQKARPVKGRSHPLPVQTKYWYFLRKNGFYNHSLHHPLQGDSSPIFQNGRFRGF